MAGYQRMVSYLYEYNRGEKGTNVGYAKLEIREDIAKMIVSIRLRSDVTDTCPVGFYYWEGRQAYHVPIGEIKLRRQGRGAAFASWRQGRRKWASGYTDEWDFDFSA